MPGSPWPGVWAPTSQLKPRPASGAPAWTRPDEGNKQALPEPPCPSPCSNPAPPPPRLGSLQRAYLPDPQAPPHPPEDDSSWRMSVSPPNLASTKISVPQSPRKPAASVCPPAATDARGHASAPPRAPEGLRRPGGLRAVLCAVRADVLAGGGDSWPWCFLTGPSPGPHTHTQGRPPRNWGFVWRVRRKHSKNESFRKYASCQALPRALSRDSKGTHTSRARGLFLHAHRHTPSRSIWTTEGGSWGPEDSERMAGRA